MPSVIGRSTSFRSPLLRRVGEQNASICQSFGCILLAYQPYSTVAPSLVLCCCLCLGAAWLRAACRPRVPQSSTRGRHRLPCLSVRASRAPRACRAPVGFALGVGVRPHSPVGFVASRASRACAPVCASFGLACPFSFGLVAPPRPSSEGGASTARSFAKQKALPFQVRLLQIHSRSRSSSPLRGCHGQCIHPCGGNKESAMYSRTLALLL